MNRPNRGFTLMELLIVIGVLGILAAGLLAAIDPFEQLKKARDTNNRNAATELLQASQRYYANHGYLPWFKGTGSGTTFTPDANCTGTVDPWAVIRDTESEYPHSAVVLTPDQVNTSVEYTCINTTLGTDGEIKSTFFGGIKTNLYLQSGSPTRAAVCFAPESKSNRTDASTKYYWNTTNGEVQDDATKTAGGAMCPDVANDYCLQCFE